MTLGGAPYGSAGVRGAGWDDSAPRVAGPSLASELRKAAPQWAVTRVSGVCAAPGRQTPPQPGRSRCSGALCRVTDVQAHSVSPEFSAVLRQPRRTDALSHTAAFCRHTGLQGGCLAWYKYPRCSSSGWDSCSSVECLSRGSFCAHG